MNDMRYSLRTPTECGCYFVKHFFSSSKARAVMDVRRRYNRLDIGLPGMGRTFGAKRIRLDEFCKKGPWLFAGPIEEPE